MRLFLIAACTATGLTETIGSTDNTLHLQLPGEHQLRILSPNILELTLVTARKEPNSTLPVWNFVKNNQLELPKAPEMQVTISDRVVAVETIGFKRRVLYAPFKTRDLRILNSLYLQLAEPVKESETVRVKSQGGKHWDDSKKFEGQAQPLRWSPAIHINQSGYMQSHPKKAIIGYYLGSLGELQVIAAHDNSEVEFSVIDASSGKPVHRGKLNRRVDVGFPFACYQNVYEADFTSLKTAGYYRVVVPGLGSSLPFRIDDAIVGLFARTYALGVYHQRCGAANILPYTRFEHGPCHTAPAEIPTMEKRYEAANESLAKESENFKENPRHLARQLKSINASLYPFVTRNRVDVAGGHHDAGDYSKYTINSASFIHHLLFAADAFPGAVLLDNLGLPESGDGKSDLLQEVKWEADFLAKMQDLDGGFFFLVYPRDREYENDVLPDKGDPQVVFPKTTSVTAAAVAALAQCASSPSFKEQFPHAAAAYLQAATRGWNFLMQAIEEHGKDGAYQKITHYGDDQMHDDELAWAACEMYLATKDETYHAKVQEWLHPKDPSIRKWGWWRLFDAYGSAIRSYAFASRTGRLKIGQLSPDLLAQCEAELEAAGIDHLNRAERSAYGTSFPDETKKARTAGWYFSGDAAFDLAVAAQFDYPERRDPRPRMVQAIISNLNYEQGCNPVNITYLTGLGHGRQHEIVHQYAQNDSRDLPPTGIPLGNVQGGFGWLFTYKEELDALSFPPDGHSTAPYPIYDRWGDAFNLSQEFVILNQAKSLGYLAWLMAQTPLKDQLWHPVSARIETAKYSLGNQAWKIMADGIELNNAVVIWENPGAEAVLGRHLIPASLLPGRGLLEAEAVLPDGRRVFARVAR